MPWSHIWPFRAYHLRKAREHQRKMRAAITHREWYENYDRFWWHTDLAHGRLSEEETKQWREKLEAA